MNRYRSTPWRARLERAKSEENFSENAVGNRSKGLELDLRLREFEINQLTQRNNFFMIFQGVLIAGLVQSQGTAAPLITFSMSLLGVATSVFQIGMAGGAKYWQSRWEASTRSSEIAIVLELIRQGKLAVQTFTHDSRLLTPDEQRLIKAWNDQQPDPDQLITDDPDFIKTIVLADISTVHRNVVRKIADVWVQKLAIAPKWSVSRIPIWIGAILFIFWATIALHVIRVPSLEPYWFSIDWIELVPLKLDRSDE